MPLTEILYTRIGNLGVISDTTCLINIQTAYGKGDDSFYLEYEREIQWGALME